MYSLHISSSHDNPNSPNFFSISTCTSTIPPTFHFCNLRIAFFSLFPLVSLFLDSIKSVCSFFIILNLAIQVTEHNQSIVTRYTLHHTIHTTPKYNFYSFRPPHPFLTYQTIIIPIFKKFKLHIHLQRFNPLYYSSSRPFMFVHSPFDIFQSIHFFHTIRLDRLIKKNERTFLSRVDTGS